MIPDPERPLILRAEPLDRREEIPLKFIDIVQIRPGCIDDKDDLPLCEVFSLETQEGLQRERGELEGIARGELLPREIAVVKERSVAELEPLERAPKRCEELICFALQRLSVL